MNSINKSNLVKGYIFTLFLFVVINTYGQADSLAIEKAGLTPLKAELAKIPIDPKMIHIPERSTETVDVYHVNFQNIRNSSIRIKVTSISPKQTEQIK